MILNSKYVKTYIFLKCFDTGIKGIFQRVQRPQSIELFTQKPALAISWSGRRECDKTNVFLSIGLRFSYFIDRDIDRPFKHITQHGFRIVFPEGLDM